jgi:DNA-binding transcriptional LysR family regulator
VDVIRESFDIAVRIGELQDTSLIGRSLGVLHYVLAASPKYLDRRGTPRSIDDLKQHACLRYLQAGRPLPFTFADGTRIVPEGPFDMREHVAPRASRAGAVGGSAGAPAAATAAAISSRRVRSRG